MTKIFKKVFSLVLLFVFAFTVVACTELSDEEKEARDIAKSQLQDALDRISWTGTDEVSSNIQIYASETEPSEYELANNAAEGLIYGVYAKFESSDPNYLDVKWVATKTRTEVKDTEGKVVGLEYVATHELRGVVNQPEPGEADKDVKLTVTGYIDYSFNDGSKTVTRTISLSKKVNFTIVPKLPSSAMTIGELEAIAMADWAEFTANGITVDGVAKSAVVLEGTVTQILFGSNNGSFILTDEEGKSIYVYNSGNTDVQLLNKVSVKGVPAAYYNGIQIGAGATVTILDAANDQLPVEFEKTTIADWHDSYDITVNHDIPGKLVEVRGILTSASDGFRIVSEETGEYFLIYASSYGAFEKTILESFVGKVVIARGAVYDFHSGGYWRFIVNCYEFPLVEVTLSNEEKFAADKASIQTSFSVDSGDTINLPKGELANGSVLSDWVADIDGVIDLETLKTAVVDETVTVHLTATLKLGDLEEVITVTVEVKAVKVEKITIKEFLEKPVDANVYYTIAGVIVSYYTNPTNDAKYGNIYLNDGTGEVLIYGVLYTKTETNKQRFNEFGLELGDSITVTGTRGEYNQVAQMAKGYYTDSAKATSIAEFSAKTTEDKGYYALTGKVVSIANTKYGNLTIEDADGNSIYVYGLAPAKGVPSADKFVGLNIKVGNIITIVGQYGFYNNPQVANAYLIANAVPASEQELLDEDVAEIRTSFVVQSGGTLTLPAGPLTNGSVISEWVADNEGFFDENFVAISVYEDTIVTFTATVTLGELSVEVQVEVTIKAAIAIETMVKTYDFVTGFYDHATKTGWGSVVTGSYGPQQFTSEMMGGDLPAAVFKFSRANRQNSGNTIDDRPVMATGSSAHEVTLTVEFEELVYGGKFQFLQWGSRVFNNFKVEYSMDGSTWSVAFNQDASFLAEVEFSIPEGALFIKLTLSHPSSSNNQIGLTSLDVLVEKK